MQPTSVCARSEEKSRRLGPYVAGARLLLQNPSAPDMVLVDTSVWLRFLRNRAPHARALDALLGRDEVVGHEMVFGELMMGDRGRRRTELLDAYAQMDRAPVASHLEMLTFVRARGLLGHGIGWIDAHLLASAVIGRHTLWTADAALVSAAERLGIGHDL